ncbi:MAG: lysine--tRNA ligase [Candidatus Kerfeldbacteria bacterium]|nr:lysine--tRNA ligase [Candidatus Kerfeldbacteria bacterium]
MSERDYRLEKLQQYNKKFGTAYPAHSNRSHSIAVLLQQFDRLTDQTVILAGRLRSKREHGKLTFAVIEDASGTVQLALSQQQLGVDLYQSVASWYDVGDIVEVTGQPFTTKAGERSLLVQAIRLLTKALQPLPEKWHGLQDEETRYRKRYLDLLVDQDLRNLFVKKAKFWNSIRQFLLTEGFLEVETPVLETTPGGADAEPFTTHHNALDIDLYLRISMGELWQKRLMVAGYEKTFEIGRQFRNEGISPEHLQDYTQMEFYWAYADYQDTMKLVERMYKHCIMETFGTLQFTIHNFVVNFDQAWPLLNYVDTIQQYAGIDITAASVTQLQQRCEQLHIAIGSEQVNRARLYDSLWKFCRKQITGPAFLVNHPVEVSPLAKRLVDQPHLVERYQVIVAGSELGNGYSELNDPIDQQQRFIEQAKLRTAGDVEAQRHDHDFVEALELGMPPTSGFGVSERLFSFLADRPIRECVLFPLLRPKINVVDQTLVEFSAGISRAAALDWMTTTVTDVNLQRHMLATEALMRALAERFKVVAVEAWGIAGLLHDIDWENTTPETHSMVGADWLEQRGVHPAIVAAVREHNYHHNLPPSSLLSKCLMSLEQLTGFIMAVAYVRPDRTLATVEAKSVKKKLKDKAFARGVDRAMIEQCQQLTGLTLDEAIAVCLKAMQAIASDLDL